MFVQIHMLQSMPPGNLNRDDTGQPKKCIFGGVTRGRISSQCLKRNIRFSPEFTETFGDRTGYRTKLLPKLVAEELRAREPDVSAEELEKLMKALAARFSKGDKAGGAGSDDEDEDAAEVANQSAGEESALGDTPQLVFFPRSFPRAVAEEVAAFRSSQKGAYALFLGEKVKPKPSKQEESALKSAVAAFVKKVANASKSLTVDVGLFGRMTTSDLVVNVEAACQVAHAISTHETFIESDYFTAMDDLKTGAAAAYLGRGEDTTFYNAAVYYKYLNIDTEALLRNLAETAMETAAQAARTLVLAAALANPTGKQNSFANHAVPELILVEMTRQRRPVSYANAFLQPVDAGDSGNLMAESAKALYEYLDAVAAAFAPPDVRRLRLAVGAARGEIEAPHDDVKTLEQLADAVYKEVLEKPSGARR